MSEAANKKLNHMIFEVEATTVVLGKLKFKVIHKPCSQESVVRADLRLDAMSPKV